MTAAWNLPGPTSWREPDRRPALALALAAHGALLVAVGLASLLRVHPPGPSPDLAKVFWVPTPPPPERPVPVDLGRSPARPPLGVVDAPRLPSPVPPPPPAPVADLPQVPTEPFAPLDTPVGPGALGTLAPSGSGGPGGPGGGGPHRAEGPGGAGVPWGGGDSAAVLVPGGDVSTPRLLRKVSPEYPTVARVARLPGRVVLQAVIGRDGRVEDVEVLSASSPVFRQAAIDAVRRWRYTPATLSGRPVRVTFRVVVEFVLD